MTLVEKGKIDVLMDENKSISEIARYIGRSRKAVRNYIMPRAESIAKFKLGRPVKFTGQSYVEQDVVM